MRILAIDPGKNLCAYAHINDGTLKGTELWSPHVRLVSDFRVDAIVVEGQYAGRGRCYAANDMMHVAFAAGFVAAQFGSAPVYRVPPSVWKGSVPKAIHQARILDRLTDAERAAFVDAHPIRLRHNVVDAIGIGLWAHENQARLERYRFGEDK